MSIICAFYFVLFMKNCTATLLLIKEIVYNHLNNFNCMFMHR